jgi:hypothetical protein
MTERETESVIEFSGLPITTGSAPATSALRTVSARLMLILRGLPPWAWLACIGFNAFLTGVILGRSLRAPIVFSDELIYSQLARRLADGRFGAWADVARSGYGITYPLLLAPLFSASHLPAAYAAAKIVNAAVFATAAVPAFLLARRILPVRWSMGVAVLTVFGPQTIFSALVMTENLFLPLFLWTCLAAVRMIERPTPWRQGVVGLLILFATLTRIQAVALVPGLVVAVIVASASSGAGGMRDQLRPYLPAASVFGLVPLLLAVAQVLRGHSIGSLLGAYSVLAQGYSPWQTVKWTVLNIADLDLLLGVALFAVLPASVRLALRSPTDEKSPRIIAAVLVGFGSAMLIMVGAFSGTSEGEQRVHDRYLFYLVPLAVMVGLWGIRSGSIGGTALILGAATAGLLPILLPYENVSRQSWVDSLALLPWQNKLIDARSLGQVTILTALGLAVGVVALRRKIGIYVLAALTLALFFGFTSARAHARLNGAFITTATHADWIDRAVEPSSRVSGIFVAVQCAKTSQREARWISLWRAAFFNRSVRLTYFVGRPLPGGEGSTRVLISSDGTATAQGRPVTVSYALVERGVRLLRGRVIAQDTAQGLALVAVHGPIQIAHPKRPVPMRVACRATRHNVAAPTAIK